MKEIVFVTPQIKTGGGNRVFFELANILVDKYKVKVVYPNNSDEQHTFSISKEVEFTSIGKLAKSKLQKLINVVSVFYYLNRSSKNSIVIISDPIMAVFSFLLIVKKKYRFVQADDYNIFNDKLIISNDFLLKIYKFLTKFSYRLKYRFIFNSKYSYQQFCHYNSSFKLNPVIVHPAINHSIFNIDKRSDNPEFRIQLCLVARKHPLKGLATFIQAWQNLPEIVKEKIQKVVLVSHDDLSTYDVSEFEVVVPSSDVDIVDVYSKSDIFISTSLSEGFGLPALEAMACGCGVITSNSGGVDEFAVDNFNCMYFPVNDYNSLIKKIEELVFNKEKLHFIQFNGIETSKQFSWDNSTSKLEEALFTLT